MSIKPALSAEEWKWSGFRPKRWPDEFEPYIAHTGDEVVVVPRPAAVGPEQRHVLAALCLHGQPFGFTREDVEIVTSGALMFRDGTDSRIDLLALADRIESLLPPETE